MHLISNLVLLAITFIGGSLPMWIKGLDDKRMHYLLAFSGSFLLSITFLHLLPETFGALGSKAGLLLLGGFFVQLLIQRVTHGIEHGHVHVGQHEHHVPVNSILLGLSLHAFMEGLPLGFNYKMAGTEPALYMAVAAHKIPEAILITSLVLGLKGKNKAILTLFVFSLLTPLAGILAAMLGAHYTTISQFVLFLIPIVAGAFIHIATTIFFESGTKQHMLTWQKTSAIIIGVGMGLVTLLFE
jgi:zinc and cadmium transporter